MIESCVLMRGKGSSVNGRDRYIYIRDEDAQVDICNIVRV